MQDFQAFHYHFLRRPPARIRGRLVLELQSVFSVLTVPPRRYIQGVEEYRMVNPPVVVHYRDKSGLQGVRDFGRLRNGGRVVAAKWVSTTRYPNL